VEIYDKVEKVSIDEVYPYHNNPKEHPAEQIDKICSSIKHYGFTVPLIIDADNEIIAGHGRYKAAQKLGMNKLPCIRREDLTEEQGKELKNSKSKDVYICQNCGEVKIDYKSNVFQKGKFKEYCSRQCGKEDKRVKRTCKNCGKEFKIYKSKLSNKTNSSGNFCCRECYNEYQETLTGEKNNNYNSIEYSCDYCGKPIKAIPSKIKNHKHHYCSRECKGKHHSKLFSGKNNPTWRGGHKNRKGDFEKVKKEHFSGNQFCAICGTTKNIHIHHIVPYRYTEDNSVNNLIPVCASCHRKIEVMTWNIIDEFKKENLDIVKMIMNNILQSRQSATKEVIRQVINNEAS